jgi:hypothetical protein
MDNAHRVLTANPRVQRSGPAPRLSLLIELEPGYRVFFGNLADLLLSRGVPHIPITSRPAPFWNDVFVPSGTLWYSFTESTLLHLLLIILFVWGQSRVWVLSIKLFPQRDAFHTSITYYPPARSFPAIEGRASSVRARSRAKQTSPHQASAHQTAIPVTPQQKQSIVTPPDIRVASSGLPKFPGPHAAPPMVPFSATAGARRNALAGPSEVVAPPPQIDQATARRLALPQASAVAPAPELGGPSTGRAIKAPDTGSLRVVPPPPSVQNAGNSARAGQLSSSLGPGPNVVRPPPSVEGNAAGDARLGSMADTGSQVVPPAPSVQSSGGPARGAKLGLLSGADSEVVPPPTSVEDAGNSGAGGRLGSLTGNGSQIVPPPSSVVESAGTSAAGGPAKLLDPMDPSPVVASSPTPSINNENKPTVEELPLGLIGVVFTLPGTSFFSNFEVFVAKRRVGKDQMQLVKLVYEFLPYQRRLSEYDLNNLPPRVIKLRVTPDPSCDESLWQMMQSDTDPTLAAKEYSKLPAALRSSDLTAMLPCYRTTASDFQKAMSRAH